MSSPFSMFRKHQKAMIAMVGVLCMIAFTILPIFLGQGSSAGSAPGSNQVVARTARGEIREPDLENMIGRRQLANAFMRETLVAALGEEIRQYVPSRFGEPTERSVVETHLLVERAKELGVVIADDTINAYLKEHSYDKVTAAGFRAIVSRLKTTQAQVFDALRTELAAEKLLVMSGVLEGPASTTPGQRWDYYKRLNSRATVELIAIRAEDFIDEVDDPDPKTLRAFFDAHKEQEPVPGSPEPGFKVPAKAAFQYVKASYDRFYDERSITDEQVKEYFEASKDPEFLYTELDEPTFDAGSSTTSGDTPRAEREDDPVTPEGAVEPKGDQPDEPMADPAEEPTGEQPTGEQPTGEQPAGEAAEPSPEQSSDNRSIENMLAFYQPPDDDQPVADTDGVDQAATGQPASDALGAADGQTPPPPATIAGPAKNDTPPAGAKQTETLPAGPPPPISDDLLLPRDIRDGPKPKYEPLWKVEDAIRKRLAQQQANEKIEKAFDAVKSRMDRYERQWTAWNINQKGKEPARPDFVELAAAHALTDGKTSMVSRYDVAELYPELGGSKIGDYAFADVAITYLQKYKGAQSGDSERNRYLFWKIGEREAYVPELKEVEDEVVRAWKLIQAREPAKKKAAELMAKARRGKESLAKLFGDKGGDTIIQPPAFSWMTTTSAGVDSRAIPEISEVEGVEDAGDDFMRGVFSLQKGKVGSAMNQPQTVVYVIRVVNLEPPLSTLRQLFIAYPFSLYQTAALAERQQLIQAWMEQIRRDADLEWVRPPDQRS